MTIPEKIITAIVAAGPVELVAASLFFGCLCVWSAIVSGGM